MYNVHIYINVFYYYYFIYILFIYIYIGRKDWSFRVCCAGIAVDHTWGYCRVVVGFDGALRRLGLLGIASILSRCMSKEYLLGMNKRFWLCQAKAVV